MPDVDFLRPPDGVEPPVVEIAADPILAKRPLVAVLSVPDMDVVGILQAGRIDVVDPEGEKSMAIRGDEPPSVVDFLDPEEPGRLGADSRRAAKTVSATRVAPM